MKFFAFLRRFQQDVATLPHGHGGGFMGEGQSIQCNILLKTDFFDSLKGAVKIGSFIISQSQKYLL